MACFYFSDLYSCLGILPKTRSVWQLERQEKWFDNIWENRHSSDFSTSVEIRFTSERLELREAGWSCPPRFRKTWYSIEESNPHWETSKLWIKFIEIIHAYLFPLQSLVNSFISSFYFCVSIGNMHTKIIRFSIFKKCEKLKQILTMSPMVIKIYFNGKGFSWDHTKFNRFI